MYTRIMQAVVIISTTLALDALGLSWPSVSPKTTLYTSQKPIFDEGTVKTVLGKEIQFRAEQILSQANEYEIPISVGRKSIIMQMAKEPKQLGLDIPRTPSIAIGGTAIPSFMRMGKSPEQQFSMIARRLEHYVHKRRPALSDTDLPGHIGPFTTVEIVYTLSQTFSAAAQVEAYETDPILSSGEWGARFGDAKLSVNFFLSGPENELLVVKTKAQKRLDNIANPKLTKSFVTEVNIFFNLTTAEVTFRHQYTVDRNSKAWTTNT